MSTSSGNPRVIAILGATGHQGGGVLRALLKSKSWIVRAVVRDPGSSKSQKLLAEEQTEDGRLDVVAAHVYDIETLRKAFAGAFGVFAMTWESHPDKMIVEEEEMQHEIEAGRNIVLAAKECNIQHFVFSSLPDMMQATSGRFPKLYHMNNKYAVEKIAREELPGKVTCLIPGFFYTNLHWRHWCRRQEDGVVRFSCPIPSDQVAQFTDPEYDMGSFAARVFELGIDRTRDKTYLVLSARVTPQEMVETFTRVTGQPAIHSPTTAEEFGNSTAPFVGPAFKEDAKQMMEWAAITPKNKVAYGSLDPEADRSAEELGLAASSFEEWLKRTGWTGPDRGMTNRANAARDLIALLTPLINEEEGPALPKASNGTSPVPDRRKVLSAVESLLHTLTPEKPLYAAFHDGQVHDPLGGGSYAFREDLVRPLLEGLVHDEARSDGDVPGSKAHRAYDMPSRPIVIHAGAQPNNSPHCGTLIVFCYAFAVARAIRDRMRTMAANAEVVCQPPPVSVDITFVDTAPVNGAGMEVNGIHYQKSYRDTPSASTAWTGDYHEVLSLLSTWSDIPVTTTVQSDFFSNPFMPQLLDYMVTNHHTLGRQLSPKYGTLALRAACPVAGCGLAEKHGRLNQYTKSTPIPTNTTTVTKTSDITPPPTPTPPATITFHCPHHGPHTLPLTPNPLTLSRLEANAPTRNLLRSMAHLLDTSTHHVRVTGADYAGGYQEAMLYRPLAEWAAAGSETGGVGVGVGGVGGRTPHILYAPLVVDWSGAKLSKSLYVREGGYEGMRLFGTEGLGSYRVLKGVVGGAGGGENGGGGEEEGLRRIWEEVGRWVADPRKLFRCYSVEYLRRVVVEGRGWE
ncbi:uncharacterized protein B0H64DRAFT_473404 [Chaetomium fimeti]|uniref:NmrA-like domain-containing protein n=1 Tax=Chaetomium fimeti TaxID=1854472 RepID=A0AAE0HJB8_9PEZI|nr:hypothetical protein B0H64DRAFT_473404 [Chaetomium fimeti]